MNKKSIFIIILLSTIAFGYYSSTGANEVSMRYTSNPQLPTILPSSDWLGTPLDSKGRFVNLYHPFESSFGDLIKWQTSKNPQKEEKKSETRRLLVELDSTIWKGSDDYLVWLGHATYLFRIDGTVFLTDPLLLDNTFLKRDSDLPFPVHHMPRVDFLLLSHNHRDHCDEKTLRFLAEKNPQMKVLTGLGLQAIIDSWLKGHTVQEAGWYQQYTLLDSGLSITYVPSRHWSRRWLWDDNQSLWGGFYIKHGEKSIYFMGDSGAGAHFADIQRHLGSPDYCLMGVGAFKPEWFMHQAHISPSDAINAFNTLQGKYFIPMHFGTFDLSDEPRMEPWDILVQNQSRIEGTLVEPVIGRNLILEK